MLNQSSLSLSKFRRVLSAAFAFFILISAAQQNSAATFTVTNTADSNAGSLRQAVLDANATTEANTINFNIPSTDANCDANGVCTITLTGGVITAEEAGGTLAIINQTGASKLVISGNNLSRVFDVSYYSNVLLDGLTITRGVGSLMNGGYRLGAIRNDHATLTIKNSVLTQNTGGFVITSQGGGPLGTLNVINTTINDNAGVGISFDNNGTVGGKGYILNSTISNNGSPNTTYGGGIYFIGDQLRITNSTISGNRRSYGIYISFSLIAPVDPAAAVLTNTTVTANQNGGIQVYQARADLRNTIVAGNTGNDLWVWNAAANSLGNNLIGTSLTTGTGNISFSPSEVLNNRTIGLAPLADNGGATQTHALLQGSPAINAGNNCVLTGCGAGVPAIPTDQRGVARVGTVDIGAYEFVPRPAFDFDGDGKSDVAVFRPSTGFWYRLTGQNNSFSAVQFGASSDRIAPADYDGDGKTDIAVFREGAFAYFYILDSSTNTFRYSQFGTTGDLPLVGDWDGDGKADLAVYREGATSNFYYRPTSQPSVDYNTLPLGTIGDKPLLGDFDGDGRLDPAVFRASSSSWIILRSSLNQITTTAFGLSTDIPVPADYDGDGQTNIAVFRPSNGTWYTSQNAANNYGAIVFGTNGDTPVPADYDGDGKADAAVFRSSTGAWYLNRTTQGFTGVAFGQSGDLPIPNAYIR